MIVERAPYREDGDQIWCRIWLDEPVPGDFLERLLGELLAFASPVGLGKIEAHARRHDDQAVVLAENIHTAAHTSSGHRRLRNHFWFDYVAGNRVKVSFLPEGVLGEGDEDPEETSPHPLLPMVSSTEFEEMYGHGSLEGAVRMALMAVRTEGRGMP